MDLLARDAREGTDAAELMKGIHVLDFKVFPRMKKNEVAIIGDKRFFEFAISTYVKSFLADDVGDDIKNIHFRYWRSPDPSAKTLQYSYFIRTEFMRTNPFGKIMAKRVRRIYETGIISCWISNMEIGVDITRRDLSPFSFVREMTRKDLYIKEVEETPQIHFTMITGLLKAFLFMSFFAILIYMSELYTRPITVRRLSKNSWPIIVHRLSQNNTNIRCRQMRQKNH